MSEEEEKKTQSQSTEKGSQNIGERVDEISKKVSDTMIDHLTPTDPQVVKAVKTGAIDMLTFIIAATAFVLAAYAANGEWKRNGRVDIPKVAVVDVDLINASFLTEVMSSSAQPSEQAKVLEDKSRQLVAVVDGLKDKGYIVINKAQVLSYPTDNDVTAEVARAMGVNLIATDRYSDSVSGQAPLAEPEQSGLPAGNPDLD